jgi:hypothetical protein
MPREYLEIIIYLYNHQQASPISWDYTFKYCTVHWNFLVRVKGKKDLYSTVAYKIFSKISFLQFNFKFISV